MVPRKQIVFPLWSDLIFFPQAVLYFVFSALEYNLNSCGYEFEGMALTPSCKGLDIDLMD